MKTALLTGATTICLFALSLKADQGGEVWAPPTYTEVGETNAELRANSPDRYLSTLGDFNGDGQQDRAAIVVRRSSDEAAVLVYLSGRIQGPIVLRTFPSAAIRHTGIASVKPGSYRPACARGGGADCDPATRVTLPHDGVSIFTFESSATYYWLEGDQVRSVAASD
jgi:hypothetical protein